MSTEDEVRRAAKAARQATLRRDEAIVRMRAEGASLREVAHEAGLTHTAVAKIVARHEAT